jgi:uncharacterized membrane protein YbhN (UPF0104 family)
LIAVASAVWNIVTALAFLGAVVYSYRLGRMFKGGKISKTNTYALWGFVAAFLTFLISFVFNLASFSPTTSYGISVKDLGILIAGVLIMASLREASRFWSMRPSSPEESKPPPSPD